MRVETREYVRLAGRRPRGIGCWVFEFVTSDGRHAQYFTSKFRKYEEAAAEAKLMARVKVGRRGTAVLCP